jgi:hypothetical protein
MAIEKEKVDMSEGGIVALCLGNGYDQPTDYAYHPRVHTIVTKEVDVRRVGQGDGLLPSQTRLVVMTDHIPGTVYQLLQNEIRKRRVPFIYRKSASAVLMELKKLLPDKKENGNANANANANANGNGTQSETDTDPTTSIPGQTKGWPKAGVAHGALTAFVIEHADLSKGSAEEGRRLFKMAQMAGLKTTLASITQAVSHRKRKVGRGDIPVSVSPQSATLRIGSAIEEAIVALGRIKADAETLEMGKAEILKENETLKAKLQLLKEAFRNMD